VGVRARWNEVAVYANPSGAGRIAQAKLNPYVVEGENEAVLVFRAAEIPPGQREKAGQPSLRVRVMQGRMGEEAQNVLAEMAWKADQGRLPATWRAPVRVGEAFGRWSWEAAPRLAPNNADRAAILSLIDRLRAALETADTAVVNEIFAVKNEEMARALGLAEADASAAMEQYFAAFWGQPERRMEPLDDGRIELAAQAGGRLVAVVDREGGPVLRGTAGDVRIAVPVMVTHVGGRWLIAR
jgi:hypothetical protein